jgi:uncharacterized membrane protein
VAVGNFAAAAVATTAHAQAVSLREKPDHVTEASVVVEASPAQVYGVATDYARWPQILTDIKRIKVESGGRQDAKVRFRSVALEHEVAVKFDNIENRVIRFHSVDAPPGAHATGTYRLDPIDGGTRTRVVATFYLDVGGVAGLFVRDRTLRAMRQAKLRADLGDVRSRFAREPQTTAARNGRAP